jgi:hypothetical protein
MILARFSQVGHLLARTSSRARSNKVDANGLVGTVTERFTEVCGGGQGELQGCGNPERYGDLLTCGRPFNDEKMCSRALAVMACDHLTERS